MASIYRLPEEEEWEWAAGGEPDGSIRKYPWPKDKGEPGKNLANFNKNVDATTPVDRYPEGATPLGLMDMAGNVWEWMENYYREDKDWKALCGVGPGTMMKRLLFAPPATALILAAFGTAAVVFGFFVPRPQSFSWNSGTLSICYSGPALFFAPVARQAQKLGLPGNYKLQITNYKLRGALRAFLTPSARGRKGWL